VSDTSASELFPVDAWGTTFAVPGIPENDAGGFSIKISSGFGVAASVDITSSGGKQTVQIAANNLTVIDFINNSPLYIVSSVAIQVVQFVRGSTSGTKVGTPTAIYIPSTNLYTSSYYFSTWYGSLLFKHYVIALIDGAALSGMGPPTVEGVATSPTGWTDIPGSTMKTKQFVLSLNYSSIVHPSAKFGAIRFSYVENDATFKTCSLGYLAGADYSYQIETMTSSSVSSTVAPSTAAPPTTVNPSKSGQTTSLITDCSCLNITGSVLSSHNDSTTDSGQF